MEELNHTSTPSESMETPIEKPEAEIAADAVAEATADDAVVEEVIADESVVDAELSEDDVADDDAVAEEAVADESVADAELSEDDVADDAAVAEEVIPDAETPEGDAAEDEEPVSMDAISWEDQLEESLSGSSLKRGELREGTILDCRKDGFVVDVGAKRDGFVPLEDIKDIKDREFNVGDNVAVVVTRFQNADGNVELSLSQAVLQEDWLIAEKLLESQEVYESAVTSSNRGGLTVAFGRLRGFVPMSQLIGFNRIRQPAERQRRLEAMVDEEIMLKVIEVNRRRRRLILSQRAAAKEWRVERRKSLLVELEPDQVRRGRISQITDFGLFVNLGGMDGLVHISELSWGRIENPAEVYRTGQRVKVKVLSVDRERQRIALSIKALTPDPWESVVVRYQIGELVQGHVTQVVDFGVFVELEPGVEGLLHNSELRDVAQRDELTSGEKVLVKVIRIESDRRRIGLSVRQVRPEEWEDWAITQLEKEAEEAAAAEARAAAAALEAAAAEEAAVAEEKAAVAEVPEADEADESDDDVETEEAAEAEAPAEDEASVEETE
ncbi:MAG: S1 RNA-binding domain-containing protein, partial [Anaerolineae bacterium]|nr:S1 RNA-binding domain-containing protein [Anaerolineae bacterium]